MSRGKLSAIRDPAIAIAASKCYLARTTAHLIMGTAINSFHPKPCSFCDLETERLAGLLNEYMGWSGLRPARTADDVIPIRPEVERFEMLPREEQRRLVTKAQAIDDQ